jgi:hypothetical protein
VTPLKSHLRRGAAIITGVLIGLSGLTIPSAQAAPVDEDVAVTGGMPSCNTRTGKYAIEWTISNSYLQDATIHDVQAGPVAVPGLVDGLAVPQRTSPKQPGQKVFIQDKIPGNAQEAYVTFTASIPGKGEDRDNIDIVPLSGDCKRDPNAPCDTAAEATFHHTFAVTGKETTATVTLDDDINLCADEPVTLASYFAPRPQNVVPQYLFDHKTATITNVSREVTLVATLPACDTQIDLFFGADALPEITEPGQAYGDRILGSKTGLGARSTGVLATKTAGTTGCRQPDVTHNDKCDGTVDVNLSNTGALSKYAVDFTITAGAFTKTVTVQPGKAETVPVPAGSGQISVTADGLTTQKFTWKRPADCPAPTVVAAETCQTVTVTVTNPAGVVPAAAEITYAGETKKLTVAAGKSDAVTFKPTKETAVTVAFPALGLDPINAILKAPNCTGTPSPSPSTPTSPPATGLPITGAAGGAMAGGAAMLLLVGGALYLAARRRRIKFTA